MTGWIIAGILVLAVVVLVAVGLSVAARLRPLRRAVRRLSWRAEEAQQVQAGAARLEQHAADLEAKLAEAQERAETLRRSGEALREARHTWHGADAVDPT